MMKTVITTTTALALGLGLLSAPRFASGYVVNGQATSPTEAQVLVPAGVQQGAWVVNGYGNAPAERASFSAPALTETGGKKCYYVLLPDRSKPLNRNALHPPPCASTASHILYQ